MTIESTNENTPTTPAITYSECYAQVFLGDCLEQHEHIKSGSVDLILTDLPYGTVKNAKFYDYCGGVQWDIIIDTKKVYEIANRILRKNGKMVLFSQEPYTSRLINEATQNIPFSYRAIWEKDNFANALLCNKAMAGFYEDILVFSKNYESESNDDNPCKNYFESVINFINLSLKQINNKLRHRKAEHSFYYQSNQFRLCTEETYNDLIKTFKIDKMQGFLEYSKLKEINREYKNTFSSTFNLWEGNKYKSNILKYKKDYNGYHPTQKPILLLEDLIKTFSNEGNLVVDLTMGSGSTGVACKNTNRSFIGIEKDENYFKIAEQRINARTLFS